MERTYTVGAKMDKMCYWEEVEKRLLLLLTFLHFGLPLMIDSCHQIHSVKLNDEYHHLLLMMKK